MPSLSLRASLRAVVLMAASAALGATLVGTVAAGDGARSEPAEVTYTRSASCPGLAFRPIESGIPFEAVGVMQTVRGYAVCNAALPNGAVVTKVQFTVRDATPLGSVQNCALVRQPLTIAQAQSAEVLASVPDSEGQPGNIRLNTSNIAHATVNNAAYAYYLQCESETSGGNVLGIYGASITYRISATKG